MNHQGTILLETERLILRRFVLEDAEAMYRNWTGDAEVTKFLTWPTHPSAEVSGMLLTDWVSRYENADYYNWAIVLKGESGEPIGNISVVTLLEKVAGAEIGYCMGRRWWGHGVMAEALAAVIGYLLGQVGMQRIQACHDVNNPASGRVMEKCGMQYEGTLRASAWNNQGVCDASWYAILSE